MLDDSSLAVYAAEFGDEDSSTSELTDEYFAPACFSSDLFALANCNIENDMGYDTDTDDDGEESESGEKTPWRWMLIGPERSGTGLHVDPLFTSCPPIPTVVSYLPNLQRWLTVDAVQGDEIERHGCGVRKLDNDRFHRRLRFPPSVVCSMTLLLLSSKRSS